MSTARQFAKVAFKHKQTGARLEGEFIADTGATWMVKPSDRPVQVLNKTEWVSAAPVTPATGYGDFFDFLNGQR